MCLEKGLQISQQIEVCCVVHDRIPTSVFPNTSFEIKIPKRNNLGSVSVLNHELDLTKKML